MRAKREEEALFEVWWETYRQKKWALCEEAPAGGPPAHYMLVQKEPCRVGWLARAGLRDDVHQRLAMDS